MYMFSYWYAIGFMVIVFLVGGGITEREIQEENQNVPSQESIMSIDNQNEPYTRSK